MAQIDELVEKKRKADQLDKAGSRPHDRERGRLRIVTVLPKPAKNGPKYPRAGIDPVWLENNPEADVPSRISDEHNGGAAENVAEPDMIEHVEDQVEYRVNRDVGLEGEAFVDGYRGFRFAEQAEFDDEGREARYRYAEQAELEDDEAHYRLAERAELEKEGLDADQDEQDNGGHLNVEEEEDGGFDSMFQN